MGLGLYLARAARLEIQGSTSFTRVPGVRGVTPNQDPAPRETIDTFDGPRVVLGEPPLPTLEFNAYSNFFHPAWETLRDAFDNGESHVFRLVTQERARGSAIRGTGNTVEISTSGVVTLSGKMQARIEAIGSCIKILTGTPDYFVILDIADTITAAPVGSASLPLMAATDYQIVMPPVRVGNIEADVSHFQELEQEGRSPFGASFTLSPHERLPDPALHV